MNPVLELRNAGLTYRRGQVWSSYLTAAVVGVDLCFFRGETVGLVGESGSGKTSLGRLALGIVLPTTGQVLLHGRRLTKSDRRNGRLQVVLQHPEWSLNPRLKCSSSIEEPLAIVGSGTRAERRAKVLMMLSLVGLDESHADRYPHELSGGQRQRVSIARSLITDPDFIVFDEVVSALDVSVQGQILNLIRRLQGERGFSAMFISHDLGAVRYVSDRVAVMYSGRLMEVAPADTFYSVASHPYTRSLQIASDYGNDERFELRESQRVRVAAGCPLAPRCPFAVDRCKAVTPELRQVHKSLVACHRAEEIGSIKELSRPSRFFVGDLGA